MNTLWKSLFAKILVNVVRCRPVIDDSSVTQRSHPGPHQTDREILACHLREHFEKKYTDKGTSYLIFCTTKIWSWTQKLHYIPYACASLTQISRGNLQVFRHHIGTSQGNIYMDSPGFSLVTMGFPWDDGSREKPGIHFPLDFCKDDHVNCSIL